MYLLRSILSLLVVSSIALASPKPLAEKSITIDQVLKPKGHSGQGTIPHRGIASYANALSKYGASKEKVAHFRNLALRHGTPRMDRKSKTGSATTVTIHETVTVLRAGSQCTTAPKKAAGSIPTIPDTYDEQYVSQLLVGGRTFWIDFDTGSSDFWLFGPNITGLASNQTVWAPSSTSTEIPGESWYITYGDGSLAGGSVWTDEVGLGAVKIPQASVEIAEFASGTFEAPSSGILGLGFDNNNMVSPNQQKTIFTTLINSGLISRPVLAANLKHNAPGSYTFGDTPWYQYSGSITYTPADGSEGYWMITPLSYSVSGTNNSSPPTSLRGVVDTGTTLILVNDATAEWYWDQVSSAVLDIDTYGGWVFACNETLPDFKLVMGQLGKATYTATVPGSFMNYEPVRQGMCFGGIQPTFDEISFNIYGDVLLKSAFVVFDRGTNTQAPRVGFADKSGQ